MAAAPADKSLATIPLTDIAVAPGQKVAFCAIARASQAKLEEIHSKKNQLGASAPASLFQSEIAVDGELEKVSPRQLAPDFAVIHSYLDLFVAFAGTKDPKVLTAIASQMSQEDILSRYFDATVRVETVARKTCGFGIGI